VEGLFYVLARLLVLRGDGVLGDDDVTLGEIGPLTHTSVAIEERVVVEIRLFPPPGPDLLLNRILGYRTWELRSFNYLSSCQ
jgi:hypothetical protein